MGLFYDTARGRMTDEVGVMLREWLQDHKATFGTEGDRQCVDFMTRFDAIMNQFYLRKKKRKP